MPGLRSLRNRLAVIFALIIIGAIGTIYLSVTPRLEASLTRQRLDQVQATAVQLWPGVAPYLVPARDFYPDESKIPRRGGKNYLPKIKADRAAKIRAFAERNSTEVIVMSV